MRLLENKTVVITGASRGIGRGIALVLAKHGCSVKDETKPKPPERNQNQPNATTTSRNNEPTDSTEPKPTESNKRNQPKGKTKPGQKKENEPATNSHKTKSHQNQPNTTTTN